MIGSGGGATGTLRVGFVHQNNTIIEFTRPNGGHAAGQSAAYDTNVTGMFNDVKFRHVFSPVLRFGNGS
jgi:hypothetical protein